MKPRLQALSLSLALAPPRPRVRCAVSDVSCRSTLTGDSMLAWLPRAALSAPVVAIHR